MEMDTSGEKSGSSDFDLFHNPPFDEDEPAALTDSPAADSPAADSPAANSPAAPAHRATAGVPPDACAAALTYAQAGIPVYPAWWAIPTGGCGCGTPDCAHPGKHPLGLLAPHGFKSATTDPDVIRGWFAQYPDANVGIATGAASKVVVVDVDPRHGGDARLAQLQAELGALPATVRVRTGGGGDHLYFQRPSEGLRTKDAIALGIDLKADGGSAIGAGSRHASGQVYAFAPGMGLGDIPIAALPARWLEWIREQLRSTPAAPAGSSGDTIPEGARNPTLASMAGTMRRKGFTQGAIEAALLAENIARCEPPLAEDEVRTIAASISRYEPEASEKRANADASLEGAAENKLIVLSAPDFLAQADEHVDWAIEDILPGCGFLAIAGLPGHGKSWLLTTLALSFATGQPWLGHFATIQGPVLMIDQENPQSVIKNRLRLLAPVIPENLHFATGAIARLDRPESLQEIIAAARSVDAVAILLDSYVRFHTASEKDATEMARVFAAVAELRAATGAIVTVVDHWNKSHVTNEERLRGSTEKLAAVDSVISVERLEQKPLRMKLEHTKSRAGEPVDSFYVALEPMGHGVYKQLRHLGAAGAIDLAEERAKARAGIVGALEGGPLSRHDLLTSAQTSAGVRQTAVQTLFIEMERAGEIRKRPAEPTGKPGRPPELWELVKDPDPDEEVVATDAAVEEDIRD